MKMYFSNLSNEMWAEEGKGLDLLKGIVEFYVHSVLNVP